MNPEAPTPNPTRPPSVAHMYELHIGPAKAAHVAAVRLRVTHCHLKLDGGHVHTWDRKCEIWGIRGTAVTAGILGVA